MALSEKWNAWPMNESGATGFIEIYKETSSLNTYSYPSKHVSVDVLPPWNPRMQVITPIPYSHVPTNLVLDHGGRRWCLHSLPNRDIRRRNALNLTRTWATQPLKPRNMTISQYRWRQTHLRHAQSMSWAVTWNRECLNKWLDKQLWIMHLTSCLRQRQGKFFLGNSHPTQRFIHHGARRKAHLAATDIKSFLRTGSWPRKSLLSCDLPRPSAKPRLVLSPHWECTPYPGWQPRCIDTAKAQQSNYASHFLCTWAQYGAGAPVLRKRPHSVQSVIKPHGN